MCVVPQADAELGGDASSCQRSVRTQALAAGGTHGLRQSRDHLPAAERGTPGEDHQTGQTHLPEEQVSISRRGAASTAEFRESLYICVCLLEISPLSKDYLVIVYEYSVVMEGCI